MKNRLLVSTALMVLIASGNYLMIIYDGSVHTVEFISIFAIGTLFGLLLVQLFQKIKGKRKVA